METILTRVQLLIADTLGVEEDEITLDASFKEDLGADSLEIVELVMALEDAFDMEINEEEAERLRTVGDVVRYIEAHA